MRAFVDVKKRGGLHARVHVMARMCVCVCVLLLGLRAPSGGAGCPTPVCDGVCVCV